MGSGSIQGAGAPTMFQAMRRIASDLAQGFVGEGAFERAFRQSFLGTFQFKVKKDLFSFKNLVPYIYIYI